MKDFLLLLILTAPFTLGGGLFLVLRLLDPWCNCKWFCDVMGWHRESPKGVMVGSSYMRTCSRCGKTHYSIRRRKWF